MLTKKDIVRWDLKKAGKYLSEKLLNGNYILYVEILKKIKILQMKQNISGIMNKIKI